MTLRSRPAAAFLAGAALWFAPPARAQVDLIERVFGATNLQATTGNGGLTAGVSRDGDLTVLSWPSPSFYDQIHYLSANGPGARARPRMGAAEGMGAFAGLVVTTDGGATKAVTWLRDPAWTRRVTFAADDTSIVLGTFARADLGLEVVQTDFVLADRDVLVRRYEVRRAAQSPVTGAWLLVYANLSPSLSRVEQVPLADFLSDHRADFFAAWDDRRKALVHFHPEDTGVLTTIVDAFVNPVVRTFGPLGDLMKDTVLDEGALDALLVDLDAHYAPGVYAAVATQPAPDQVQVGEDATDTCAAVDAWARGVEEILQTLPPDALPAGVGSVGFLRCGAWDPVGDVRAIEGWVRAPADALADAADGELSGSRLAGAQANAALRVPLAFESGVARAATFLAFGRTAALAHAALDSARDKDPQALEEAVAQGDRAWAASLRIPRTVSPALRAFSLRALLNLRVGTDRQTGAIVASVARQPSYHLDWPRDGAFFNAALDVAGQHALVTRRLRFYARVMRRARTPTQPIVNAEVPGWPDCPSCRDLPPGSWEMNYYADGLIGGNIRLEVDNTALLVWSFVSHAGYLQGSERSAYLAEVWPVVKEAATWLAGWRDPATGLVWPANEDDNVAFTQGLQAAGTVFGALRAAARMARAMGDEATAAAWVGRAAELRRATLEHLYDPRLGFLDQPTGGAVANPGSASGGASSWLAWPERFLPFDDPRLQDQLRKNLAVQLTKVRGGGEGGAYPTKASVAAALALPPGADRDAAMDLALRMARDVADPDARFLGEVFVNVDENGDGIADRRINAVATPHLWAGILVYLTAMAYESPELFDPHERVLPAVQIPLDSGIAGGSGCGCGAAGGSAGIGAGLAPLLLAAARRRSRRRQRT